MLASRQEIIQKLFTVALAEPPQANHPLATLKDFTNEELNEAAESAIKEVSPEQAQTLRSIIAAR